MYVAFGNAVQKVFCRKIGGGVEIMRKIPDIIRDADLDYKKKRDKLAYQAENLLQYVNVSEKTKNYMKQYIICDLNEGNAPYRPRYVLPDYEKFIRNGSEFLNITPPKDFYEAVNALFIIYSYVPSITGFPVYLGNVDTLLEPFVGTVTEAEVEKLLKMFMTNIDRVISDAFVHMNIGPFETKVGNIILKLERELKQAVPNLSLKFSKDTSENFIKEAIKTSLEVGKPYFINHEELLGVLGHDYGIASCYNTLKIGGGSHTLARMNLKKLADISNDKEDFLYNKLSDAVDSLCELINKRSEFLVEESLYFESSFLAKEGLIDIDKFTSMAGIFGLYECVEKLSNGLKMGHDDYANRLAEDIIKRTYEILSSHKGSYCGGTNGKIGFHAQSGIDTDVDTTAGVRIKIGEEPIVFEQIRQQASLQKYFDAGVSDIYIFESTARQNVEGVFKIIKGAMKNNMRILTVNTSDSELIRISGYLVKRSDIEKNLKNENLDNRESTVKIATESVKKQDVLKRRVRFK